AAELRSLAAILDTRAEARAAAPPAVQLPTRRRRRSGGGWIVVLLVLAALAALAWWYRDGIQRMWRRALGPAPAPVIVVIPLDLAVTDAWQTYFADGRTADFDRETGGEP